MTKSQMNLQDNFLNQVRKESIPVTIYLLSGVQLKGMVRGFDSFTVVLESPGKPAQLVYKHAMASVVPLRPVNNTIAREDMREDFRDREQPREEVSAAPVEEAQPQPEPEPVQE